MTTRVELRTAPGVGGVAVVAVTGPERAGVAARMLARPDGSRFDPGAEAGPVLALLRLDGEVVDQALVVPRIHSIEIHVHASRTVVERLAVVVGLQQPQLAPAEQLLREALGPAQLALALEQRDVDWPAVIATTAALPEGPRRRELAALRARSVTAIALAQPTRLVLHGAQNAGKSTLLNRLLCSERAVTGDEPGLTRDPVRDYTTLAGYPYELVDTAGEGRVRSSLDAAAQELARREAATALRLLVADGSVACAATIHERAAASLLTVRTKADLPRAAWPNSLPAALAVSCLDPAGAPAIREQVGEALRQRRGLPPAGPVGGPAALTRSQLASLD